MRKKLHKILVTGGAGFIGSEFVRQAIKLGYKIVIIDKLTYAGNLNRLKIVEKDITFYKLDICNLTRLDFTFKQEKPDYLIHFAAETHVDRSIEDIAPFIKTNILGTQNLINCALKYKIKKFIHISTDEVYGEKIKGSFKETDFLNPQNPYAATKAASDHLIKSSMNTFKLPAVILRPCNTFGPWQDTEKLIPKTIENALRNIEIPLYGNGKQVREWIYVEDCVKIIISLLEKGKIGEIYNIGSGLKITNIQLVEKILSLLNKETKLIKFVSDRKGHDFRYALNCDKIKTLGFAVKSDFSQNLQKTITFHK